jgi:thiol-disulfide isomerase/thioredoxin
MKKFLILFCLVLILFACDRFEHNFEPSSSSENFIIDFFNTFADSIFTFPENIPGIMSFYHDDYNNNGVTKADVENFYVAFTFVNTPISLEATLIDTTDNEIEWRLLATELSGATFMDTTFTDILLPTADSFQFYGNQQELQKVLVELATSLTCVNCPYVEAALHNLKQQYGSRLSYVEYHINDPLDIGNLDIFAYYGMSALPTSVTQGTEIIVGGSATSQAELEAIIAPILNETPLVQFSNFNATLEADTLNGSVLLSVDGSVPLADLYLKFTLLENENTNYLNAAHEYPLNVVIAKGELSISAHNFDEPVEFALSGLSNLPDDITLIIWVQTLADPYNSSTCTVYNVTEKAIE